MMTVEEAVAGRRSIRAFLPTPVPRELIERVLTIAGRAPSGSNVQPWHVWVLQGAVRDAIVREAVGRKARMLRRPATASSTVIISGGPGGMACTLPRDHGTA